MTEYAYPDAGLRWNDDYVWKGVARELVRVTPPSRRVFELGCGNGFSAARMKTLGFEVTAVDPSTGGIAAASAAHPDIAFAVGGVEDPLGERFGQFPVVVSIEVIEHCYSPKRFAECALELLEPGGHLRARWTRTSARSGRAATSNSSRSRPCASCSRPRA